MLEGSSLFSGELTCCRKGFAAKEYSIRTVIPHCNNCSQLNDSFASSFYFSPEIKFWSLASYHLKGGATSSI